MEVQRPLQQQRPVACLRHSQCSLSLELASAWRYQHDVAYQVLVLDIFTSDDETATLV